LKEEGREKGKHAVKFPIAIATLPKYPWEPIGRHDAACEVWRSCQAVVAVSGRFEIEPGINQDRRRGE